MRIQCPHCQNALNIVDAQPAVDAMCPSCGSKFPVGEVTVTYRDTVIDRVGHFEIIEKAGAGHFGTVFRARDAQLNRTVAIKLPRSGEITEQHKAMFLREARAAAGLDHPNIVRVYEIGEEVDQIYIASQFIDGVTLRDKLQIHRFPPTEAAEFLAVIAEAIHFAHERGVVHRDLKPSNILVDLEGHPHISDFGLAKIDNAEVTVTISGVILGTPAYMSPEQARGDSHSAGPRSDVYSLGVILYEMLTGQRPFDGSTTLLLHQIQSSDPRAPRSIRNSIPRDLETICLKALAKSPEKRYATAQEMADDLRRFAAGESIIARRVSRIERGWRWMRRNPAMTATTILALLSSTVAFGVTLMRPVPVAQSLPEGAEVRVVTPIQATLVTDPPSAKLVLYPLDELTGEPSLPKAIRPKDVSPVTLSLLPGEYLVVAVLDGERFHEVIRTVPVHAGLLPAPLYPHRSWINKNGVAELPVITISPTETSNTMTLFSGNPNFESGTPGSILNASQQRAVLPFFLDTHEVTFEEFRRQNKGKPPIASSTQKEFPPVDHPVARLYFDEAVKYAERIGKRLPSEWELEFASTNGGTTKYPWGNDPPNEFDWKTQPVGQPAFDQTATTPPVFGLFSNVAEYAGLRFTPTDKLFVNSATAMLVTVRGGPVTDNDRETWIKHGVRHRMGFFQKHASSQIGFRCAKSQHPRH